MCALLSHLMLWQERTHKEDSCTEELKQENVRLQEKLDTLQQENVKAKDINAALLETEELKQENARLQEKLDTLQQEHAKRNTAAKDSQAALLEKVDRLKR